MARFRYVVADVFTDTPLQGNAVAVFTDAREIPEDELQPIAREMNLSETVFVYKPEGEGHARIRIFTPAREMPFAGHPTLGTAFVLSGAAPTRGDQARDRHGVVRSGSSGTTAGGSSSAAWSSRCRAWSRSTDGARASTSLVSTAPSSPSSSTTTA